MLEDDGLQFENSIISLVRSDSDPECVRTIKQIHERQLLFFKLFLNFVHFDEMKNN